MDINSFGAFKSWTMDIKLVNIFFPLQIVTIMSPVSPYSRAVYVWVELKACDE